MELNERIMMGIVRISEWFKKEASVLFSAVGLTFSQYNVLRILDVAPDGRLAITDVGRQTDVGFRSEHDGHCQKVGKKRPDHAPGLEDR